MNISRKVILITGATGGLGTPVTGALHTAGAKVIAAVSHLDKLAQLEENLSLPARTLQAISADVSRLESVQSLVDEALRREGRIDALVNLVGGFAGGKPLTETGEPDWGKMLRLNMTAAFLLCKAVLPVMYRQRAGSVVMIAAESGLRGTAGLSAYAASKAGLINFVETIAEEGRPHGVTANVLLPGTIDTPANRAAIPNADTSTWVKPAAIAQVIQYLCSDSAKAVSGSTIRLSSGR